VKAQPLELYQSEKHKHQQIPVHMQRHGHEYIPALNEIPAENKALCRLSEPAFSSWS